MSTFRQIIDGSLRRIGVLGGHGQTASPYDYVLALDALSSIFHSLISSGAFGRMKDVVPAFSATMTEYTAGENERVYRHTGEPGQSIILTDMIGDRPVRDLSIVSMADFQSGNSVDYIFDGQRKQWFCIDDMQIDYVDGDTASLNRLNQILALECPLARRDTNGLASYLATHISDNFGSEVPPHTQQLARNFAMSLTHNYSARPRHEGVVRPGDYGRGLPK